MCPSLFGFNAYGLLVGLGLIVGLALFAIRSRRAGISSRDAFLLGGTSLLIGAFGARLLHWFFVPGDYVPRYAAVLSLDGGFALNGGILAIMAVVWGICRRRGWDFLTRADLMAPSAPAAVLLFRLGCFCHGCCLGSPTDRPWGVCLPANSAAAMRTAGEAIHPTQLYASASAGLILICLLLLERMRAPVGSVYGAFMLLYGSMRTVVDLTRWNDPRTVAGWALPANQGINLVIALAGLVVLAGVLRRHRRNTASAA
jgi:phosphatidylglycerol---prolipoprotein diacylglyceryl transferase